ncbi:MAG: DUF4160 domain-containing protein [Gallionellaceae bacterium]
MPTILYINGFRFIIWPDDHEPPHIHVFKGAGEAKVSIDKPRLVFLIGLSKQEARFILNTVIEHQKTLLKEWEKIHG